MDASQFLSALLAIIVIDLVLAGDNAIVIALAARSLPPQLQKRAILWGAVGAIGVRSAMTAAVVWLLKIPGLLLAGGALLIWIAWKLMVPPEESGEEHGPAATTFLGAMRTIIIADAVMGLDNVLAVAGAAHGSYLLVVAGLVISVPIVVWGSSIVLRLVERFPAIIYLGAGVLLWTALKMMLGEPLLKPSIGDRAWPAVLGYLLLAALLVAGYLSNHRRLVVRIAHRLEQLRAGKPFGASDATTEPDAAHPLSHPSGDKPMLKVLIPVDGSPNALQAVRHAIAEYQEAHRLELHLLNVQPALSRHVARFLARSDRESWHRDRADAALAPARELLTRSGVPFEQHWSVGSLAREICGMARKLGAHHIVMGTARKNSLTRMLEDSVTNQVLEQTPVPVEVIAGEKASRWERWGLPAGLVGLGGLVLLAMD